MKMDEPLAICYNCGSLYAVPSLRVLSEFPQSGSADIPQFALFPKTYGLVHATENRLPTATTNPLGETG